MVLTRDKLNLTVFSNKIDVNLNKEINLIIERIKKK